MNTTFFDIYKHLYIGAEKTQNPLNCHKFKYIYRSGVKIEHEKKQAIILNYLKNLQFCF